ncbi:Tyrosine phosphatase type IVA [Paragonimus westermani]|uniref:protein-tyrosine-phosphatase n=1 Tax=Paragonimus westermani TaxID=34504 RepID=A0A8T0CZ00_9TREM|nr:Tyrosine phosphatase type IVA [Paragonimus westermani]
MSVIAPRHLSMPNTMSAIDTSRNSVSSRATSQSKLSRQLQHPHVTLIEYKTARFLITDQPSANNMENFIHTCHLHNVHLLVRVCEPTYDEKLLEAAGISVVDMEFEDGAPPTDSVIQKWFQLLNDLWHTQPDACVAVHCRAGLGRAPALVAVALIELGLPFDVSIEMIRSRRAGALNTRQIQYLRDVRPHKRLRLKNHSDRCLIL